MSAPPGVRPGVRIEVEMRTVSGPKASRGERLAVLLPGMGAVATTTIAGVEAGPQEWLSFFLESPVTAPGRSPVHDLLRQESALHARLRGPAEVAAAAAQGAVG